MSSRVRPNSPEVRIGPETETGRGWHYEIQITWTDGATTGHEATLSWADHDHLCGGTAAPSRVMEAVIRHALDHGRGDFPAKFDAATVRRWCPSLDAEFVIGG